MNAKKIFMRAFKSVPDQYVNVESRIFLRDKNIVIIIHPTLDDITWTEEKGWRKLYE